MINDGIYFLIKGGFVMWPLLFCAIAGVAIIIERYLFLKSILPGCRGLTNEIHQKVIKGEWEESAEYLKTKPGPVARILAVALENRDLKRKDIENLIEESAIEETPILHHHLSKLDTIITIAPLLGLLGTVTGMIKSFQVVQMSSGISSPAVITGGVAEALIATATGLTIAIVSLVGYNILTEKVKNIVSEMEIAATKIVNDIEYYRVQEDNKKLRLIDYTGKELKAINQ